MAEMKPVYKIKDLPPGSCASVETDAGPVALCNVEGTVYAIEDVCPHQGAPMGDGTLDGKTLICPWHGWGFDCTTGDYQFSSDVKLKTYKTEVQGDDICVES